MERNEVPPHVVNEDEDDRMQRNEEPFQLINEDDLVQRNEEHLQKIIDDYWTQALDVTPPIMNRNNPMRRSGVYPYIGYTYGALPDYLRYISEITSEVIVCCVTTLILIPLLRKFDLATVCTDSILRNLLVFFKCNDPCDSLTVLALDLIMVNIIHNVQAWPYDWILVLFFHCRMSFVTCNTSHILTKIRDFSLVLLFNAPHAIIIWISYVSAGYYFFWDTRSRTILDILVALLYFSVCSNFIKEGILSLASMFVGTVTCILYKTLMPYFLDKPMFLILSKMSKILN